MVGKMIIIIHGLLDIYSALCLLGIIYVPGLSEYYTSTFIGKNPEAIRMLCYVILVNGTIRLLLNKHRCKPLVIFSYGLEAYIYFREYHTSCTLCIFDPEKVLYASFLAICIACMSFYIKMK